MPDYALIGTAGHVDHGKSALIQALTGTDPDRLQQEKDRGITIELGFADFTLPGGTRVGVVDVPGHERFIHHMLAGIGGIDLVLLVVDAQEGVMPQTIEHLQILQLLEIQRGLVVLSKIDRVETDWLDLVEEEVRERLRGTFLAQAPFCRVSAHRGDGLGELQQAIREMLDEIPVRSADGPMRLPIDRDFTLTGFGTVVTGTLLGGQVGLKDQVELIPGGTLLRVREIQQHGGSVAQAYAGQRVALNLAGLDRQMIERGAVLATPGYYAPTSRIDSRIHLLEEADKPIKTRDPVHFFLGTARTVGRVILLDRDQLAPGEEAYAQIHLEHPVVAHRQDRFILRSYSPMRTIAGGRVIDAHAKRHKRFQATVLSQLESLESGESGVVLHHLFSQGAVTIKKLSPLTGYDRGQLESILLGLQQNGMVVPLAEQWASTETVRAWQEQMLARVDGFHQQSPFLPGIPHATLKGQLPVQLTDRAFAALLERMASSLVVVDDWVQRPGWEPELSQEQRRLADRLIAAWREAGALAKNKAEMLLRLQLNDSQVDPVLSYLFYCGELVRLNDETYLHREVMVGAEKALQHHFEVEPTLTLAQFRDAIGSARKQTQAVLEYFDACGYTRRQGDVRIARNLPKGAPD